MTKPIVLVCEVADAPRIIPGSKCDQTCSSCGRYVMIAPSGQKLIADHPDAKVICVPCVPSNVPMESHLSFSDLIAEARSSVPNLRRTRN